MRRGAWLLAIIGCGDNRSGAIDASAIDAPVAPSCAALPPTCGPAGNASCCESRVVEGGTFYRSFDVAFNTEHSDMTHPATVSSFRFDTYEVTVGRFRAFVAAGLGTQVTPPAPGAGARTLGGLAGQGGWDPTWNANLVADTTMLAASLSCNASSPTWTDAIGANENKPINCLSWYEAMAFCVWDGGFLPTEAESNYAASGGVLQRAYPWSTPADAIAIDCAHANHSICNGAPIDVGTTSPLGDGLWGQADLGGNVWEWALDHYYPQLSDPCTDCALLTTTPFRVIRGGGYLNSRTEIRAAWRKGFSTPGQRSDVFGVRCARAP